MEDFRFQPWERLSPDVTDGEADLRFAFGNNEWLFCQRGTWWFARECSSRGREGNFLFRPVLAVSFPRQLFADEHASTANVREFLEAVSQDEVRSACFRVWVLPDDSDARLAWNDGDGWIFGIDRTTLGNHRPLWRFRLETSLPTAQMLSSSLFSRLQMEWQNESSDLHFAAHFSQLPELERALMGVQTHIGTPQELARLIQSALCAFAPKWPADLETARLNFTANGGHRRFTLAEHHPFGVRQSAILGHILRAFEPRQLADSPELPLALRTLTEGGWSRSFSIQVARPSMHDRLEAMLELRAWLETHWPNGVKHLEKVI